MFDEVENIPPDIYKIIENIDNQCFVSIASLYEIAIKKNIGKLNTKNSITTLSNEIERVGLTLLPLTTIYLESYVTLKQVDNHKDPFDRLIIATAVSEDMKIISADEKFILYQDIVEIIW
jgi:PIN domain nuclease of toxin-antitoxin system